MCQFRCLCSNIYENLDEKIDAAIRKAKVNFWQQEALEEQFEHDEKPVTSGVCVVGDVAPSEMFSQAELVQRRIETFEMW